jgi:hypothetical protein
MVGNPVKTGRSRKSRESLAAVGVGTACVLLAAWRLRPAWAAQLGAGPRRDVLARPLPELAGSPTRWKERHCGWGVPRWWPAWLTRGAVVVASGLAAWSITGPRPESAFFLLGLATLGLLGLVVQVRTAVTISAERENQTWDLLRLTLLTPESLVRGKLWGALDAAFPLLTAALVPAAVVACGSGPWAVVAVVATWLAAWPILYALAACGLRASARSRSSWWGLLTCLWSAQVAYLLRVLPLAVLASFVHFVAAAFLQVPNLLIRLGQPIILIGLLLLLGIVAFLSFGLAESLIQEAARNLTRADDPPDRGEIAWLSIPNHPFWTRPRSGL